MISEGVKFDEGKLPWHLLPSDAAEEVVAVLQIGAGKYGAYNWAKGMKWSRCFSACMRHLWTWWRNDSTDHESRRSHLAHAICCLLFLLAYEKRKVGEDDRPT